VHNKYSAVSTYNLLLLNCRVVTDKKIQCKLTVLQNFCRTAQRTRRTEHCTDTSNGVTRDHKQYYSVHCAHTYTLATLREHSAYALAEVANSSEQVIIRLSPRRTECCYYAAYAIAAASGSASRGSSSSGSDSFSSQNTMFVYAAAGNDCCVILVFMRSFSVS
jgi:hypothetical protein